MGQINKHGGINGKKINAIIATFTPTNTAEMRSLCKDWTEGSPAAFAVVDGIGTWTGTNQLCVTQEGHTPLISAWTHGQHMDHQGRALPVVDRARPTQWSSRPPSTGG